MDVGGADEPYQRVQAVIFCSGEELMTTNLFTAGAWALDFIRAYNERPLWAKLAARLIFGKYAYSEFYCLVRHLEKHGPDPFYDYELEAMDYHKPYPLQWWKEGDA